MKKDKNRSTNNFVDKDSFKFDPNGSWTGVPKDKYEKPIQDADDL